MRMMLLLWILVAKSPQTDGHPMTLLLQRKKDVPPKRKFKKEWLDLQHLVSQLCSFFFPQNLFPFSSFPALIRPTAQVRDLEMVNERWGGGHLFQPDLVAHTKSNIEFLVMNLSSLLQRRKLKKPIFHGVYGSNVDGLVQACKSSEFSSLFQSFISHWLKRFPTVAGNIFASNHEATFVNSRIIEYDALPLAANTAVQNDPTIHPLAHFFAEQIEPPQEAYQKLRMVISDAFMLNPEPFNRLRDSAFQRLHTYTGSEAGIAACDYFAMASMNLSGNPMEEGPSTSRALQPPSLSGGVKGIRGMLDFINGAMHGIVAMFTSPQDRQTSHKRAMSSHNRQIRRNLVYAAQILTFGPSTYFTQVSHDSQKMGNKGPMLLDYAREVLCAHLSSGGAVPPPKLPWKPFDNLRIIFLAFLNAHGFSGDTQIHWYDVVKHFRETFNAETLSKYVMEDLELAVEVGQQ